MPGVDLKAERRDLYAPRSGVLVEVEVPPMRFLALDGSGDPDTVPEYADAVRALFTASYAARSLLRRRLGRDHVVMPLEGLWWADDHAVFRTREKTAWRWRMLIRQPQWADDDLLAEAAEAAAQKGAAAAGRLRVVELVEGRAVQTLHVGRYDDEGPVLARLHDEYLPAHGLRPTGPHHELYLGDPRRAAPERLRTVLRQPVAPF